MVGKYREVKIWYLTSAVLNRCCFSGANWTFLSGKYPPNPTEISPHFLQTRVKERNEMNDVLSGFMQGLTVEEYLNRTGQLARLISQLPSADIEASSLLDLNATREALPALEGHPRRLLCLDEILAIQRGQLTVENVLQISVEDLRGEVDFADRPHIYSLWQKVTRHRVWAQRWCLTKFLLVPLRCIVECSRSPKIDNFWTKSWWEIRGFLVLHTGRFFQKKDLGCRILRGRRYWYSYSSEIWIMFIRFFFNEIWGLKVGYFQVFLAFSHVIGHIHRHISPQKMHV